MHHKTVILWCGVPAAFVALRAGATVLDWPIGSSGGAAEWAASVFPLALALALTLALAAATGSSVSLALAGVEWSATASELLRVGEGRCGRAAVDSWTVSPSPLGEVGVTGSEAGVTVTWWSPVQHRISDWIDKQHLNIHWWMHYSIHPQLTS